MKRRRASHLVLAACLLGLTTAASADVPMWQKLLRWISGSSAETSVPTTMMDRHMQMSRKTALQPGDASRADRIVAEAREVLVRYADVSAAEHDGYLAFAPTGKVGEEVHYSSVRFGGMEGKKPDWSQPGSILYKRTPQGMKAVGVMMTAPNDAGPDELNKRAPTSIATWHRHVNFCGEPEGTPQAQLEGPQARFGFFGSIDNEAACKTAGGYWIPLAFGWMTHVYPEESGAMAWGGEHMSPAAAHHH